MPNAPSLSITFLGTGTSLGIPVIGCDCAVCTSSDPRNRRTRSSIYVESPSTKFVIDTGPDFRAQCLRENIRRIDAAVYTHPHSDHMMGFDDLRQFCFGEEKTMPVYSTPECLGQIQAAFGFAFDRANWNPVYLKPIAHVVEGPFEIADVRLTPLDVEHGTVRTVGYLLEAAGRRLAAYLPDCKVIPDESIERMQGVEALIVDCLRHQPHWTHLSLGEALALHERVRPRQTWLTHLSDRLEHASLEAELADDVRVAYDGLKLSFT
jgi:phosphoribosyl 1,2-cyclic phosphate phosphodiesterase